MMERTVVMKAFANALFISLLCGSIFAAGPVAVDDLHLTPVNTSRICYPLVNDTDADGDVDIEDMLIFCEFWLN